MDPRYVESGTTAYVTVPGGEQKKVVKATSGKAFMIDVVNVSAGVRFLYAFDNTTDAGTVLAFPPFPIPAAGFLSIQWESPLTFATGLTLASSTTQAAYAAGGADLMMRVVFK